MHEVALAQELLGIVERVAREHGARRVEAATLELGALSCVEPDALSFAFEIVRRGTLADGCELRVERLPLVVSCRGCGREGPVDDIPYGCPGCGEAALDVVSGREMRLVSIDVEDEDA